MPNDPPRRTALSLYESFQWLPYMIGSSTDATDGLFLHDILLTNVFVSLPNACIFTSLVTETQAQWANIHFWNF